MNHDNTKKTDYNQCRNCKYHYPVPCLLDNDDPECPYIRCSLDNRVRPKWDECSNWKERRTNDG